MHINCCVSGIIKMGKGESMKYVVCGLLYVVTVVMFLAILKGGNDDDDT